MFNKIETHDDCLLKAICKGDVGVVNSYLYGDLKDKINEGYSEQLIFIAAAQGQTEIVRLLLHPQASLYVSNNRALRIAAMKGHKEIVSILLIDGRASPEYFNDDAILALAENGYSAVIKLLLNDPRMPFAVLESLLTLDPCTPVRKRSMQDNKRLSPHTSTFFTTSASSSGSGEEHDCDHDGSLQQP
jgi:ankyrin repeat protein